MLLTGTARVAPANLTKDLFVLETRAAMGTASSDTPIRVRNRTRKGLMSSAENIREFITPKAKKENVSARPIAPSVTEPYFPGNRLRDCNIKRETMKMMISKTLDNFTVAGIMEKWEKL